MQYICVLLRRVRKIAKSDYRFRHVCPSVRSPAWKNSAPTGQVFMKFEIWIFFLKSVEKIQVSLKSDNHWYFTWRSTYIYDNISLSPFFYVRMTVHRNKLKWIKPTDALSSSFIGMTTLHVSGSLSAHHQEFWTVHRLWYIICNCGDRTLPGVGWHVMPSYSW